jgi:hypothetical protein
MIFDIRPLNEDDYETILVDWWKDWKWEAPHKEFLPSDGTGGLIVYDKDTPVCAGFIYLTNSKVAWVDWIISNKNYRKKPNRQQAIELLIHTLTNLCKRNGAKFSYALIKHKGLIDTYKTLGYTKGDSYSQEMIKAL